MQSALFLSSLLHGYSRFHFKTIFETLQVCYSLNDSKVAFCKTGFTFV